MSAEVAAPLDEIDVFGGELSFIGEGDDEFGFGGDAEARVEGFGGDGLGMVAFEAEGIGFSQ